MRSLPALTVLASATVAVAEPVGVVTEPPRSPDISTLETSPRSRAEAVAEPAPDQASGVAFEDEPSAGRRAQWIPRALLFVPKIVVWAAVQPVRGAVYLYERDKDGS